MGDMVITNLIRETPHALARMETWLTAQGKTDAYVIVASEEHRPDALAIIHALRRAGYRADYSYAAAKVGKQFQTAEQLHAATAIVVGAEFPELKIKHLASRRESACHATGVLAALADALAWSPPPAETV
jgi:histidyl-tRNA synthetase